VAVRAPPGVASALIVPRTSRSRGGAGVATGFFTGSQLDTAANRTSVFPKRSSAPSGTRASATRSSARKVPLRLSRSMTQTSGPRRSNIACMLEIQGSPICRWDSGERPRTVGMSGSTKTVPAHTPFSTTISAKSPRPLLRMPRRP